MSGLAPLAATGIGSVPFTDPRETVALILETLPQMPYWPQMVQLGFLEDMTAQSARGLPGLKLNLEKRLVQMDPDLPRDEALAQFYEAILSGDLAPFAFQEEDALGFFGLLQAVAAKKCPATALKGQLSGPVTFAVVVKDAEGKPILYDRELTQAVCAGLARKAAWQAEQFRQLGKDPIVFLDEPSLTGFGSAYLPISREEVLEILTQTLEETRAAAAALGSLQVFAEEQPLARLADTVPYLHAKMEPFRALPWVGDLRRLGMIAALELVKNKETKEPFAFAERVEIGRAHV